MSEPTQAAIPQVPWRQIIGMRNQIVHAYFNVKADFVWQVLSRELHPLVNTLELAPA